MYYLVFHAEIQGNPIIAYRRGTVDACVPFKFKYDPP